MCATHQYTQSNPENKLARLLSEDLGLAVEPKALRLFLLHRWDDIASAAHAIHDEATRGPSVEAG